MNRVWVLRGNGLACAEGSLGGGTNMMYLALPISLAFTASLRDGEVEMAGRSPCAIDIRKRDKGSEVELKDAIGAGLSRTVSGQAD